MQNYLLHAAITVAVVFMGCSKQQEELNPATMNREDAVQNMEKLSSTPTFTFIKLTGSPTYTQAGYVDVDAFVFQMNYSCSTTALLKQVDLTFTGNAPAAQIPTSYWNGTLVNFRLIYFKNNNDKVGTVIGSNDGATFDGHSISIPVPSFVMGKKFTGKFALRVDENTNFTTSYAYTPSVAGGIVSIASADQPIQSASLPLVGDMYSVVQN